MQKRDEEFRISREQFHTYIQNIQKQSEKQTEEHKKRMAELSQKFEKLSNRIGNIIEAIVSPNLIKK